MIIHDCEQGSDTWVKIRLGHVTASNFSKALSGGAGKTREAYMTKLLVEIDEQTPMPAYKDKNMEAGTEKEPGARLYYENLFNVKVEQVGFIQSNDYIGVSPDGLVGKDGSIEIKCPIGTTHYNYRTEKQKPCKAYIDQMQGLLWITGRKYCDFISYRPESKDYPFWYKRFYRNESYIKEMEVGIVMFVEEMKKKIEQSNPVNRF